MQLRKRSTVPVIADIAIGYPESSPSSPFEKLVARLNIQAFPAASYSQVDDVLVYALFATKRRDTWSRSLDPVPVNGRQVTREEGIAIRNICKAHITASSPTPDECCHVATLLMQHYPQHFSEGPIIQHLLMRYGLLYAEASLIRLEKVSFDGEHVTAGLVANTNIAFSTYLLTACGSMSSDLFSGNALSEIEAQASQRGPQGRRLILGPFRFGNHDCQPNCQIIPIKKTHAFTFISLRNIAAGESITVKYTKDGYYHGDRACQCASCVGAPPTVPRRPMVVAPGNGHKRHRAGKKRTEKKKRSQAIE